MIALKVIELQKRAFEACQLHWGDEAKRFNIMWRWSMWLAYFLACKGV